MTQLIILRGLPGSGKTTWAKPLECGTCVRVSRNDIRRALFPERGQDYFNHPDLQTREARVTEIEYRRVRAFLEIGVDVISDNTNLPVRRCRELMRIAEEVGAKWWSYSFDVRTVDECIAGQSLRPVDERVPEATIRRMYERYVRGGLEGLPNTSGLSPERQQILHFLNVEVHRRAAWARLSLDAGEPPVREMPHVTLQRALHNIETQDLRWHLNLETPHPDTTQEGE